MIPHVLHEDVIQTALGYAMNAFAVPPILDAPGMPRWPPKIPHPIRLIFQ